MARGKTQTEAERKIAVGQHRTFNKVAKESVDGPPSEDRKAEVEAEGADVQSTPARPPEALCAEEPSDADASRPAPEVPQDPRIPAFRVGAKALHAALKDVLGAVESRTTLPILTHVLIEAEDGQLVLTGTDLDRWVVRTLACESDERWCSVRCALPGKVLAELLGAIDVDAAVTIEAPHGDERRALVRGGRSRVRLSVLPFDDFPQAPPFAQHGGFELTCSVLADAFSSVEHAISTEETRYYLNGILLHCFPEDAATDLRLAATDGHRLARLTLPLPDGAANWPAAIVPRQTVGLLDKLLSAAAKVGDKNDPAQVLVEIAGERAGSLMRFDLPAEDGGSVTVLSKTIDGGFPDYARVIPDTVELSALLNKGPLQAAIRRVMVLTDRKGRAVRAEFSADKLTLVVSAPDLGEAREEVPCSYDGPDIALGFNGEYWLQTLAKAGGDDVTMRFFSDVAAPAVVHSTVREPGESTDEHGPRLLQVLMPMRV